MKGPCCRRPSWTPAHTLRKITEFQRDQKKKNSKRAPKLLRTIDAMGGISEYDWHPIPIGTLAEDAWIGKNRGGASPLRRRIGRHVSCVMAIWYLPLFAAIHRHVDEQLLCTGVSCSPDDLLFSRSKAEILDRLRGLFRKQAFTDDVIGPDGSLMAKLKTEIGCRMTHTKKEQVIDPGKSMPPRTSACRRGSKLGHRRRARARGMQCCSRKSVVCTAVIKLLELIRRAAEEETASQELKDFSEILEMPATTPAEISARRLRGLQL